MLVALACGSEEKPPPEPPAPFESGFADEGEALHTGDLAEIRADGRLRVLVLRTPEEYLPRSGSPLDFERRLASELGRDLGLEVEFVPVDGLDELIPALLEGRGDLVADNFTVTDERRRVVAFSTPVATVSEQVVGRADEPEMRSAAELSGRTLAIRRSSSFWSTATRLQATHPELSVVEAPERMETEELLDGVARGDFDLTLADSNLVRSALDWRNDVKVLLDLGEPRLVAWAMRPESVELRKAVDAHLAEIASGRTSGQNHTDDLDGILERGVLRVLTRNSATTYFVWRGQLMGFEFELARKFAKLHGLRLEMVVAPSREDLVPWLLAGKGDIVAANLTATPERAEKLGIAFSRNYLGAVETVVSRVDDPVAKPADLRGRTVAVRRSSSYWASLDALQDELGFELETAPEELETEAIIAGVASGRFDLTVADSHIANVELTYRDDIKATFALGEKVEHGWAMRRDATELRASVDAFFTQEFRGLFYNVLVRKYFKDPRKVRRHAEHRTRDGVISRWDPLIQDYASRYGFDWRLIAAQMHQESRFDPGARSFAGAQGLLQVLPRTAREFGFGDLHEPENGIHAGVRYLSWIRDRFDTHSDHQERTWLSLAAYNAGYGHVRDAQRIARKRGLDPDRWFGHVEQAMLLKEDPEVYRQTRFGYARGREPVNYVRAIRDRYRAYVRVAAPISQSRPAPGAKAAAAGEATPSS
ncbi:MAG: transporter substrate-binding domain-containing protein [Myxococcota bacterium]